MDKPRTPKHKKGQKTKESIISTGISMFSENGYYNVIADDIAKSAGFSVGTFYSYFKDKYDLLITIIEQLNIDVQNIMREKMVGLSYNSIELFVKDAIEIFFLMHKEFLPIFNELDSIALHDKHIRSLLDSSDSSVIEALTHILHKLSGNGDQLLLIKVTKTMFYASQGVIHDIVLNKKKDEEFMKSELVRMLSLYIKDSLL